MSAIAELLPTIADRIASPAAIVLGSPGQAASLAGALGFPEVVCYQMDLFQADRIRELAPSVKVVTTADLWDLPATYQTLIYPPPRGGERILKVDMIEQAYHVLKPHGTLIVLAPAPEDDLFPELLKKSFGKFGAPIAGKGQVLYARKSGDRPRRRHEVTFRARQGEDGPLPFLSRPGVFSYSKLDLGARALLEVAIIKPGESILDLGCGSGTNGIFTGRRAGPTGSTVFLDSNTRAVAVAEHNARANGLTNFRTVAAKSTEGLEPNSFDIVLTNPPYYAEGTIAQRFIEESLRVLKPKGRFYLVTKQVEVVAPLVAEAFGGVEAAELRGYTVLCAHVPATRRK